jgi:hypothetical protein
MTIEMWQTAKNASGKYVSFFGIHVSVLVHMHYQSDAVATFL